MTGRADLDTDRRAWPKLLPPPRLSRTASHLRLSMDDYLFDDDDTLLEHSEELAELAAIPAPIYNDADLDFMLMDTDSAEGNDTYITPGEATDIIDVEDEDGTLLDDSSDAHMSDEDFEVPEER